MSSIHFRGFTDRSVSTPRKLQATIFSEWDCRVHRQPRTANFTRSPRAELILSSKMLKFEGLVPTRTPGRDLVLSSTFTIYFLF